MKVKTTYNKLKNEYLGKSFSFFCGILIVILTLSIISFLVIKGISTFVSGYSLKDFLFSTNWNPDQYEKSFGAGIFILGSTLVAFGAVLISTPIALAVAIFINLISPNFGRKIVQPALEIFVGIPSVVYGWIGVSLLIPFIRETIGGVGFSILAAILILSIMILPTISTISSDAIKTLSKDYVEASYGLGATRWQTIYNVIIPAAKSGILTAIVLGVARAFGEALAVQMVIGNTVNIAKSLISPTATLTSILTMDMANTVFGSDWNNALWSLALILLIISFIFILLIRKIGSRGKS